MPGAVGSFRSGKLSKVLVGVTACRLNVWSVAESGADLDTTNFESYDTSYGYTDQARGIGRSFEQGMIGVETAVFNLDGNWDAAANPLDDPPGLYVREDGPEIKLYVSRIDDTFYDFYVTRILSADVATDAKGLVTFRCSGKNQGPYLRPTGSE